MVDRFDIFTVAHYYCRVEKDLLNQPCKVTAERKNCLFFGCTTRFVIDRKFGEAITKEETLKILKKAEEKGLVHKAFHEASNVEKDECPTGAITLERTGQRTVFVPPPRLSQG